MAPDGDLHPSASERGTKSLSDDASIARHSFALRALLCVVTIRRDIRLAGAAALFALAVLAYATLLETTGLGAHASPLMLAVFAAAAISSVAGFAFSALCAAILFHLPLGQVQVVQIMMVCSIAIQLLSISVLRRSISWKHLPVFLAGGMVGLPLGLALLIMADRTTFSFLTGLLICAYSSIMLSGRLRIITKQSRFMDFVIGLCGGVTGGAMAFPGAPVTIWCQMKGWTRDQQRGVFQPFILVMQTAALALMFAAGNSSPEEEMSWLSWFAVPPALLGAILGLRFYSGMSDRQFVRMVNVMLFTSGALLIVVS